MADINLSSTFFAKCLPRALPWLLCVISFDDLLSDCFVLCVISYEMTPRIKKLKTTSTDSNYNIDDLNSEDSTDDESQPRKKIPLWAQGQFIVLVLQYLCVLS